jgi:hypothetical protein
MWVLIILSHTYMNGDKHFEVAYKTKAECYEALNAAAAHIPNETIRYIGCQEK